jgi:hypothetical protein
MDNFPEVVDPLKPIEIPYLVQDYPSLEYDGLGFADFPRRKGWDVESILHTDRNGTNRNELSAFLQSWLFIAAVLDIARYDVPSAVFNGDLIPKVDDLIVESTSNRKQELVNTPLQEYLLREDVALLTKNQSGRLVVSLKQFPRRMMAWQREVQETLRVNPSLIDEDRQTQLQSAFSQSKARIELWSKAVSSLIESPAIDSVTSLSILNLSICLNAGHIGVWESLNNYQVDHGRSQYAFNVSMNPIVRERLLCCGWCPSEICQFEKQWSPRVQYFRSLIKRPLVQEHTGCTETWCKHAHLDPKTYSTRHVTFGCCCDHVDVSQQVTDFVKQSTSDDSPPSFPVARLVDNQIELSNSRKTAFIAISHVWSDGLGNTRANSLPLCQLHRIQKMVTELSDEQTSFWIDTLCVPLSREERKISLVNMIDVYQTAVKVLVLDRETEMVEFNWGRGDEAMMHMASSRWWRRLWTMQEGAVAKILYFRFKNLAVSLKTFQNATQDYDENGKAYDGGTYRKILLSGGIPIELAASSYLPLSKYWQCRHKHGQSALWAGVQGRTTSRAEDEAICFASLAGLPATAKRKLLDIEPNKRYKMLLSDMEYARHFLVPQTILFSNWPKFQEDGLRWAPTSLTRAACGERSAEILFISDRERASNALPPGLVIIAPSIALLPTRLPLGTFFFVAAQRGNGVEWFHVWDVRCDATKLPFGPIAHQLHKAEKPVLIVQNNFPQAGWICRGVLGYIYEVQEQVTLVRYLATVAVRRVLRQRVEGAKVGAIRSASPFDITVQGLGEIAQLEDMECAHECCPGHAPWNRKVDEANGEDYVLDRTAKGVMNEDSTWVVG